MSQINANITANPQAIDTLISARWIIPIRPEKKILENHAIAVKDGIIIAIVPASAAERQFQAENRVNLPNHLLSPGLINAHGHAAMSLFRGMADDTPLQEWLQDHIWPAEEKWVSEEFVRDGTQLAMAEMLRSGTTTFSDMYFFPNVTAKEASQAGMRAQISFPVFDFPSIWGQDPDDYIRKGLKVRDDFKHNDLIECVFGPHAPYTISDEPLRQIARLAAELDIGIHMHVHENAQEIADELHKSGSRPIDRLHKLDILTPKTQLVHMTTLNGEDITQIKETGAHIIHCPTSNLKLASGMSPIDTLMSNGINIAIGTDSAASNNCLDLFSEMRIAALLAKAVSGNASALNDWQTLEAATLGGAKALAIDNKVGSLEIGKRADIIALDFSQLEQQPLHQPIAQLVYTPCGHLVTHSWVDGKPLMADRQLLTIDEHAVIFKARSWLGRIANNN